MGCESEAGRTEPPGSAEHIFFFFNYYLLKSPGNTIEKMVVKDTLIVTFNCYSFIVTKVMDKQIIGTKPCSEGQKKKKKKGENRICDMTLIMI